MYILFFLFMYVFQVCIDLNVNLKKSILIPLTEFITELVLHLHYFLLKHTLKQHLVI